MNTIIMFAIGNLASFVCVAAAAYLASNDKQGWGWFLFVAVFLASSIKFKD